MVRGLKLIFKKLKTSGTEAQGMTLSTDYPLPEHHEILDHLLAQVVVYAVDLVF